MKEKNVYSEPPKTISVGKKIRGILGNVIVYLFVLVGLCLVAVSVFSKKSNDGSVRMFGHEALIVVSESMAKCDSTYEEISAYKIKDIPLKSMVFVELVPDDPDHPEKTEEWFSELKVGDVLTFRYVYSRQVTITHRIRSIEQKENGGYVIHLIGDNRGDEEWGTLEQVIDTSERETSPNFVVGKVVGQSQAVGWLVYALKQPKSLFFIIIIPCVIVILFELMKIFDAIKQDRQERALDAEREHSDELENLRAQLADLQRQVGNAGSEEGASPPRAIDTSIQNTPPPDSQVPSPESIDPDVEDAPPPDSQAPSPESIDPDVEDAPPSNSQTPSSEPVVSEGNDPKIADEI